MGSINHLNTLLVCLDLTDIDQYLIEYAAFLSQKLKMGKVIFFHAIQAYDLPDKSNKNFPDLKTSLSQRIEEEINSVVSSHFKQKIDTNVITKIEHEDAANVIIDFTRKEKVDLTLIGQKYGEDRTAHYGHKIASEAETDLMFIPENPELQLNKILCATDLSKDSEEAFLRALDIATAVGTPLMCYYLYDIRKSYFPATTMRTQSMLEKKIRKRFRKYLTRFDVDPESIPLELGVNEEFKSQAEKLYESAETEKIELLIVGARGRTSVVTTLLGNVTERLRRIEKQIPVIIIKNSKRSGR
jgi:nucleotide-binding universal stress UspA family protein